MHYLLNGTETPLGAFDAVEVHPMNDSDEPAVSGDAVSYWSVALHYRNGGCECVADLPTKESAEALARALGVCLAAVETKGE